MEGRFCNTCYFCERSPGEEPCVRCNRGQHDQWKPIDAGDTVYRGFDPGAPEGDMTNTRLDWPLDGREIFTPKLWIDDTESGPVLAVTRMPLETVIAYAIDGIKDHASKIGLRLTDKTLGEHDLFDLTHDLANMHECWVQLETEMAELRKAGEHGNGND